MNAENAKATREVCTNVEISAKPLDVWAVFADVDAYTKWNPFIIKAKGSFVLGQRSTIYVKGLARNVVKAQPIITQLKDRKVMVAEVRIPFLFHGVHSFRLEDMGNGKTMFIQNENFKGLIPLLFWRFLEPRVLSGFTAMNEALKNKVEAAE